jgi:hypothetical protein
MGAEETKFSVEVSFRFEIPPGLPLEKGGASIPSLRKYKEGNFAKFTLQDARMKSEKLC